MDDYQAFLATKAVAAPMRGMAEVPALAGHLFGYQRDCVDFLLRAGSGGLFLDTGLGKALRSDWPVCTPDGWRPIADLRVGDRVFTPAGAVANVIGTFPQGVRDMFTVTFSDGAVTECDGDHLWTVNTKLRRSRGLPWRTKTLAEISRDGLRDGAGWRHFIPMPDAVPFAERDLPLDPYLMGAILGDGCIHKDSIRVTTDEDVVARLRVPEGACLTVTPHGSPGIVTAAIVRTSRDVGANPAIASIRGLGLMGCGAAEKFIPDAYLYASVGQRMALLAGLLDTDGHVRPDGNIEWGSVSLAMASGVQSLVRSLGGTAALRVKFAPQYQHMGERRSGRTYYRMSVRLPAALGNPFRLDRKARAWQPLTKYQPQRAIVAIEPAAPAEAVCIKIDSADGLFVIRDYVVTHNTACELEWCRHAAEATNGRALILTPLAVARQIEAEGKRWGYPVRVIREQDEAREGINITNYDRLDRLDHAWFGAVALDEASILKSFAGKTTRRLIEAFAAHNYRLAATATPAPNDHMELGNYAEFLGLMPASEMLMRWFVNDTAEASQSWRLKGHAVDPFWNWMASWSRMAERPSDLGHSDDGFVLEPFRVTRHRVEHNGPVIGDGLFGTMEISATDMHAVKRQTAQARAARIGELVRDGEPWLIWCDTDYEADALMAVMPADAVEVRGSHPVERKEAGLAAFVDGTARILVSKPSVCGYGMNFQHCARMAFVGRTFSYEAWYQAVRRCWRFGQKRAVEVHLIVAEGEDAIGRVIDRKADGHAEMKAAMRAAMARDAGRDAVRKVEYQPTHIGRLPSWLSSAA